MVVEETVEQAERSAVEVRTMRETDLDAIVRIDAIASGRRRPRYFELMIERSVRQAALQVSLVAETEGIVVGFLLASLFYGEYGLTEPTSSIESIGVDPAYRGHGVGHRLMHQLRINLGALGVSTLRTEVGWDELELLGFFRSEGFRPAARLCLDCSIDPTAPSD